MDLIHCYTCLPQLYRPIGSVKENRFHGVPAHICISHGIAYIHTYISLFYILGLNFEVNQMLSEIRDSIGFEFWSPHKTEHFFNFFFVL